MTASLRHRFEYAAFRILRTTWSLLPETAALRVGAAIGLFVGCVLRYRRADVDRHLCLAFPERTARWRHRVARGSYAHLGREAVVLFRRPGWSPVRVRERTRVEGLDELRAALEAGTGAVLLTGHLGGWEIGGAAITARGIPLEVVAKGMSNGRFQRDLFVARERLGMRVVEMGDASMEALRALHHGGVVAVLGDQSAHRGGLQVSFFGCPASTARGPALFAARSGAPVFVGFVVREPGSPQRYALRLGRLPFAATGDLSADAPALLEVYTRCLEAAIRSAPEQYFWQHRRWKRQPGEEPPSET